MSWNSSYNGYLEVAAHKDTNANGNLIDAPGGMLAYLDQKDLEEYKPQPKATSVSLPPTSVTMTEKQSSNASGDPQLTVQLIRDSWSKVRQLAKEQGFDETLGDLLHDKRLSDVDKAVLQATASDSDAAADLCAQLDSYVAQKQAIEQNHPDDAKALAFMQSRNLDYVTKKQLQGMLANSNETEGDHRTEQYMLDNFARLQHNNIRSSIFDGASANLIQSLVGLVVPRPRLGQTDLDVQLYDNDQIPQVGRLQARKNARNLLYTRDELNDMQFSYELWLKDERRTSI